MIFRWLTLRNIPVSTFVVALSVPMSENRKTGGLSYIKIRHNCDIIATLLDLSRSTVSKVMSACTPHWKKISANRNMCGNQNWQKEVVENEKGCLKHARTHSTAAHVSAELNILKPWRPCFHRTVLREFRKSKIHSRLCKHQEWLMKLIFWFLSDYIITMKCGYESCGKALVWSVVYVILHVVPCIRKD